MLFSLFWLIFNAAKRFGNDSLLFLVDSWKGGLERYRIDSTSLIPIELHRKIVNFLDNVLLILFINFVKLLIPTFLLLAQFGFRIP